MNIIRYFFISLFILVASASVAEDKTERTGLSNLDVRKVETKRGIKYWYVNEDSLDVVYLNIAFSKAGYAYEDQNKNGTAYLASILLSKGAGKLDETEFQESLARLGAVIDYSFDQDNFYISVKAPNETLAQTIKLLALSLKNPRFEEKNIELAKAMARYNIENKARDLSYVGEAIWSSAVFPDHPYSNTKFGNSDTLDNVKVEDLQRFAKTVFNINNIAITAVGKVKPEDISFYLDNNFNLLSKKVDIRKRVLETFPVQKEQTVLVQGNGSDAVIFFGMKGIKHNDPDFYAAKVLSYIYGGDNNTSKLSSRLKNEKSLVYYAYSDLKEFDNSSMLTGFVGTISKNAKPVLALIIDSMKEMQDKGIKESELSEAKQFLKLSFTRNMDSNAVLAQILTSLQLNNLNVDFLKDYDKNIDKIDLESVNKVARRMFNTTNLTSVIVGDLSQVNQEVKN